MPQIDPQLRRLFIGGHVHSRSITESTSMSTAGNSSATKLFQRLVQSMSVKSFLRMLRLDPPDPDN